MKKSTFLKGLSILWITFFIGSYAQCLWKTSMTNNEMKSDIIGVKIKQSDKCIVIDLSLPNIKGEWGKEANSEINLWTNEWILDAKNTLKDYKAKGYICNSPYQLYTDFYRQVENLKIASFYIDYYKFLGGAHGITERKAYNIDKKTGKILKLNNLFKKEFDFKGIIDESIKKEIANEKGKYFDDGVNFKGINEDTNFFLTDKELIIYYDLYELAPYASGIPEFRISLESLSEGYIYK